MRSWLYVHAGLASASGVWYLLWSGIVGDIGLLFTGIGCLLHALIAYRHANCHQHRCPRIGRFPVAGGEFKTCRKHHPDPVIRGGIRQHHLHAAHQRHNQRIEA